MHVLIIKQYKGLHLLCVLTLFKNTKPLNIITTEYRSQPTLE